MSPQLEGYIVVSAFMAGFAACTSIYTHDEVLSRIGLVIFTLVFWPALLVVAIWNRTKNVR